MHQVRGMRQSVPNGLHFGYKGGTNGKTEIQGKPVRARSVVAKAMTGQARRAPIIKRRIEYLIFFRQSR